MKIETNEKVNLLNHWKVIDDSESPMSEIERDLHWFSTHPYYHLSTSYANYEAERIASLNNILDKKDNYEYEAEKLSWINKMDDNKQYREGQYIGRYFTYQLPFAKCTRYMKILNEYCNDNEHITYDYLCVEFRNGDGFAYNTNIYYCSCTSPLSGLGETYKEIDKDVFMKEYNKALDSFNSYLQEKIKLD